MVSATFYEPNTYRVGANGNIWRTKNGKWMECKDTTKVNMRITYKHSVNIILNGDSNTEPIFILNFNGVNVGSPVTFEVLTTREQMAKKKINILN